MGTDLRANALALNIPAPAVLRCALVYDVVVYTVIQLAILLHCLLTGMLCDDIETGDRIMELTVQLIFAVSIDSLNT